MDNITARLLKEFEQAVINYSWKGSKPPDEQKFASKTYQEAKKKLVSHLETQENRVKELEAKIFEMES